MTERQFRPEDKSQYSWRDHVRELMRLKYGMRGKDLAEALIGESEEEKYMKYLIRNYGYAPESTEELPESRPMRDLLNVQGGGPSDLGALDAVLMGVSGSGTPVVSSAAAGIESGMLAGDAYGEYLKGNPFNALLMGAGAAVPPLLRYMNPPPTKKKDLSGGAVESGARPDADIQGYQLEGDTPDLSRRKAVKNIGLGIGALATAKVGEPIISQAMKTVDQAPIVRLGSSTVGRSPPLEVLSEQSSTFLYNNKLVEDLIKRHFPSSGKVTESARLALRQDGWTPAQVDKDITRRLNMDQEAILEKLSQIDPTRHSVDEIKVLLKEAIEADQLEFLRPDSNMFFHSKMDVDEMLTDEYIVDAIETLDIMKDAIRHDPATQEALENFNRIDNMSDDELVEEFGGVSQDDFYDAMDEVREAVEKFSLDPVYFTDSPASRSLESGAKHGEPGLNLHMNERNRNLFKIHKEREQEYLNRPFDPDAYLDE